jgi:hypothetical protein
MKGPNGKSVLLNRATVSISSSVYDRRALDCTDNKALVNSLNHLTFLTSSSVKVRDAMVQDGAIERLVAILYECRDPKNSNDTIMYAWKWVLALQCLVLAGTRGSEKLRKKLVDAGIIPILATILDNHFLDKKNLNLNGGNSSSSSSNSSDNNNNNNGATGRASTTVQSPMTPSPVSASNSVPNRTAATGPLNDDRILPTINGNSGFSVEVDINRTAVANVDIPSYGNIRNHLHNEQVVIHTEESNANVPLANVVISDIRGALDDANDAIMEAQDELEKFTTTPTNSLEAILHGRALKDDELELLNIVELVKCLQKLSESDDDMDVPQFVNTNFKSLLSDYILANELNERIEISNLLNPDLDPFNTFFGNDKLLNPLSQAVPRTFENGLIKPVADDVIWSLQLLAFISKYTYLRKPLTETYLINGLSFRSRANSNPPPLENELEPEPEAEAGSDEYMGLSSDDEPCLEDERCFKPVKQLPETEELGYFAPETEQMSRLRTLTKMGDSNDKGIVSDYLEIIKIADPVAKATCLERIRLNASRLKQESLGKIRTKNRRMYIQKQKDYANKWRYENLWNELETPASHSKYADKDMQAYTMLNIFPLVERFTVKTWFQEDICYWAAVVVRNANRRDERMNGRRQCANLACGKWEDHPKQFSKCRRCKRAKYCSRECQTKAWMFHKHWCVPASTPTGSSIQESPSPASRSATTTEAHHTHHNHPLQDHNHQNQHMHQLQNQHSHQHEHQQQNMHNRVTSVNASRMNQQHHPHEPILQAQTANAGISTTEIPVLRHPDQAPTETFVRRVRNHIFTRSESGELIGRALPGSLPDPNMFWEMNEIGEIIARPLPTSSSVENGAASEMMHIGTSTGTAASLASSTGPRTVIDSARASASNTSELNDGSGGDGDWHMGDGV